MISIVGTGRVGSTTAFLLAINNIDDLMLIDIIKGLPQGIALDINHALGILGYNVRVYGSNDFKDIAGSDIVIVTAGIPRRAGMSREELADKNARIIVDIANVIKTYAEDAIVILTTNPVDVMTYLMYRKLNANRKKVIGFGGLLDSGRFRYYLSKALGIGASSINAYVIGQHGKNMLPLPRLSNIVGRSINELLDSDTISKVVNETVNAGSEIIRLCGFSSMYAPAVGLFKTVETIVNNKKNVIISSVVLDGEYGVRDVAINVPVIIGRNGVEEIIEIPLNNVERELFMKSVEAVKQNIDSISEYFTDTE